jgi:multidrug efflux pump subunit AcrA (membrane-fusion protein)
MQKDKFSVSSRKKGKKKVFVIAFIVLAIISVFAWRILNREEAVEESGGDIPSKVEVMKIDGSNLKAAAIEKTATLKASNSALALAEYSGRIKKINFEAGDYVKKGQVLAFFDQSDSVNSAKLNYNSAKESYDIAEDNLEKTKEIAEESLELADSAVDKAEVALRQAKRTGDEDQIEIAEENYEAAKDSEDQAEARTETQINSAKLQLEQSKNQLKQAEIQYKKSFIEAPVSGYIVSKEIEENDYLNPGTKVAEISGKGSLKAKVFLNEKEAKRVKPGDEVKVDILGNSKEGKLEAVSSIANSVNQRYEALVRTDIDSMEYANKNATITFQAGLTSGDGFFAPIDAVNIGQQRNIVFLEKDGKAISSEVELGQTLGDRVEIVSGLKEGDNLVVEGNRELRDGEAVEIEN